MRSLNAKVGTKQIRLDASGCASRDPGFRQEDIDDARVTESETLVRRFRYDAPNKELFKRLQKDLTARG